MNLETCGIHNLGILGILAISMQSPLQLQYNIYHKKEGIFLPSLGHVNVVSPKQV